MVNTAKVSGRRAVRYADLSEFMEDVEHFASSEHRTLGNWTYAQILQHLADAIRFSLDGFPETVKAPWYARVFIAPLMKNSLLTKTMKPGFTLPKGAAELIPSADIDLHTALHNLRRSVSRLEHETPSKPHPFLGSLASQEWDSLTLRHSELHMSFVVSAES
ncbi:MAG: DUF1569 domain-containing protein [Planctomycetales bacterium]|nr:DUF1569 domain-containing protein [Planctomycetales bacterium]